MKISGKDAVLILNKYNSIVELFRKDNTDKFWSYKLKNSSRAEFAFDPNTVRDLIIRFDQEPLLCRGVENITNISGDNVSTALGRVFTGGRHVAKYKAKVIDEEALLEVIDNLK